MWKYWFEERNEFMNPSDLDVDIKQRKPKMSLTEVKKKLHYE